MMTQAPTGITAQHRGNGWNVVHWDAVSGADYYESWHEGEGHPTQLASPTSALLAIATGTHRYTKIRNVVGNLASTWVTVTLNHRGEITNIEGDDEQPPPPGKPPNPPGGLRVQNSDGPAGKATVAWDDASDAQHWQLLLEGSWTQWRKSLKTTYTFTGLTAGATYGWQVRAVNEHGTSTATRSDFVFEDEEPPPPPPPPPGDVGKPKNVRAHCITHQSSKIEWDRDPQVHEYEVWLDSHRDQAQTTQDTLVTVTGLTAQTKYIAYVVAHTRDGAVSEPGSIVFETGKPEPPPIDDPDTDTAADWPAPQLVVWPLENGKVRATWTDPAESNKPTTDMGYPFWHVSLDGVTWWFAKQRQYEFEVLPGAEVMVSVYGVWDNTLTAIATKGVSL